MLEWSVWLLMYKDSLIDLPEDFRVKRLELLDVRGLRSSKSLEEPKNEEFTQQLF